MLRLFGWSVDITVPDHPKCIICVAPHTSNWDFILGKLAYASAGRKAGFLMKETWFFFPLGCVFRAMGGISVPRQRGSSLAAEVVERFRKADRLTLAITPEGTRSLTSNWRTGFLHIAREAGVPIMLGAIDYATRRVVIEKEFAPTGHVEADMKAIKQYYSQFTGYHSHKFTTADQ